MSDDKPTIADIVSDLDTAVEQLASAHYQLAATRLREARRQLAVPGAFARADDLAGNSDLAAFFGLGLSTISGWYRHRDTTGMPEPVTYISNDYIPVWSKTAVIDWWVNWKPGTQNGNGRRARKVGSLPWEREHGVHESDVS